MILDPSSFSDIGSLAGFTDYDDFGRISGFTPANHVGGWGKIRSRLAVVCADDFTSAVDMPTARLQPRPFIWISFGSISDAP